MEWCSSCTTLLQALNNKKPTVGRYNWPNSRKIYFASRGVVRLKTTNYQWYIQKATISERLTSTLHVMSARRYTPVHERRHDHLAQSEIDRLLLTRVSTHTCVEVSSRQYSELAQLHSPSASFKGCVDERTIWIALQKPTDVFIA